MNHHPNHISSKISSSAHAIRNFVLAGETVGEAIERARRAYPGRNITTVMSARHRVGGGYSAAI